MTEVERLLTDTQQSHRQRLNDLLLHYGLTRKSPGVSLLKEKPPKAITTLANEINADLIVCVRLAAPGCPPG